MILMNATTTQTAKDLRDRLDAGLVVLMVHPGRPELGWRRYSRHPDSGYLLIAERGDGWGEQLGPREVHGALLGDLLDHWTVSTPSEG
jgi:hypothetical protein